MSDRRRKTVEMLADINRLIKTAESYTVAKCDDETRHRASKVLTGLRDLRREVEARHWTAAPQSRFSFSVRDLFFTMTVVALLVRVAVYMARKMIS